MLRVFMETPLIKSDATLSLGARWWTYQRERFPLAAHAPLVLTFSASAVCFSSLLRSNEGAAADWPSLHAIGVAFACCLLMFMQLRIADEFKDYEEDLRFRPYRPVQRGLVSLRSLGVVFVMCGVMQALLTWSLAPRLLILLLIAWTYLALMSKEFFAPAWLKRRPIIYLFSHMCIMPLIDLLATGCDWVPSAKGEPGSIAALSVFLAASYFNGIVIEIGRKIRSPQDEETGVQTYSALWGPRMAIIAWLAAMLTCGVLAVIAAVWINAQWTVAGVAAFAWIWAAYMGRRMLANPAKGAGKSIELVSGLWTIGLYLALGLVPLLVRMVHG